jgi:hypothetical protein
MRLHLQRNRCFGRRRCLASFSTTGTARGRLDRDDEGVEFPSLKAAYEDATQAAVDMSMDACCSGQCATQDAFEIRDESGRVLAVLPFAEALSRAQMG